MNGRLLLACLLAGSLGATRLRADEPAATPASDGAAAPSTDAASADALLARQHYATGRTYFEAGRFREAAREFEEAYRLSKLPDLLYNIGVSYERLDDPGRAIRNYERYLAAMPQAAERVEIESKLFRLSQRSGKIAVHTSDGSELFVDGEDLGAAPQPPVTVTEGRHAVEVRRPGLLPGLRDVEVKGGLSVEVTIEPTPIAPAPIAAPAPVAAPAVTPVAVPAPAPAAASTKRPAWIWPVVGAAAAVVVVVAGVLVGTSTDYAASERASCTSGCALIQWSR